MLKHDTNRETAALRIRPTARLTLALALLAGTTTALAQDAGLSAYADDRANGAGGAGAFEEAIDDINQPRAVEDMNFDVSVSDYDLVDLHVNNEDLGRVLQLLSIQSQRNIITSNTVEANVTADLYSVTFYEALDAILHVNGFGYIEKGNFIFVYTREELAAIEQAARQRESRVFRLNYLNAFDAATFTTKLLSEGGAITSNGETEEFTLNGTSPTGGDGFASDATLVVWDYPENLDAIGALITEIDTKPVQVLVEATILQTTLNEANAFGVDFAIINDMDFLDFVGTGGPLSAVNGLISGAGETVAGTEVNATGNDGNGGGIGTSVANIDGPATLKAGIVNEDVAIFLRVLDQVTDVTVVSNPKILTLNRMPARVLVGTKVGYLNTTTTETATTQTVEFLDTGTQLAVRPFVSDSGLIRLELRPQVSSAQLREVSDNTGNTVTIPDEDTTELTTNIMLQDGQTAVLGGLFTEITTATRRQVPVLGDIPIIGTAFRGHDDSTRRNEIIFLVTPSLVNDALLDSTGELASSYVENSRVGARRGTLPFSRERRVGRLLIEARQHADSGDTDMAIYKIQKALALAPMSADARVLLEELTNEKHRRPSRSLMEGMIHRELLDPMPGVVEDERFFQRIVPKPDKDKGYTGGDAMAPAPTTPVAAATTTPPVTTEPATGPVIENLSDPAGPATAEAATDTAGATEPVASDWIEFTDTAPGADTAATGNAEVLDFDAVEANPSHEGVIAGGEGYDWAQAQPQNPAPATSAITIEDLPPAGQWAWPQQGQTPPVQLADADSWSFAGPETFADQGDDAEAFEDEFAEDTDWSEFADEPAVTLDDVTDPNEDLGARYALAPDAKPGAAGFDAPADDVLSMITAPATTTKPAAKPATTTPAAQPGVEVTPLDAQAQAPKASSARRGGYLVVPLPAGGVVQIPWPEQQSVESDGVRWREFTSVPVDRMNEGAFDALDR